MKYTYNPTGVCSFQFDFEIEDDVIKSCEIIGGCPGNTVGISKLIEGLTIDEVILKLENIPCGMKKTSCPDQIAKALKKFKEEKQG